MYALPIRWCAWRDNPGPHAPHIDNPWPGGHFVCPGTGTGHATEVHEVWERSDDGLSMDRTDRFVIVPTSTPSGAVRP